MCGGGQTKIPHPNVSPRSSIYHVVTFLLPLMAATQADINIACFSNLERYTEVLPLALLLQGRCVAQMGHRLVDSVLNNTFGLRLVQRSCSMMSSRTGAAPAHRSIVPCHGKSTVPAAKCGKRPRDRGARSWNQVPHPLPRDCHTCGHGHLGWENVPSTATSSLKERAGILHFSSKEPCTRAKSYH